MRYDDESRALPRGAFVRAPRSLCVSLAVLLGVCAPLSLAAGAGPVLITEGEAMLPEAPTLKGPTEETTDGPRIIVLNPEEGKIYAGPVDIDVLFETVPGGSGIRLDTLRVMFVKLWEIDITERFLPFLRANRLYVERARIPSGRHLIRLSIADERGKTSTRLVRVAVQ